MGLNNYVGQPDTYHPPFLTRSIVTNNRATFHSDMPKLNRVWVDRKEDDEKGKNSFYSANGCISSRCSRVCPSGCSNGKPWSACGRSRSLWRVAQDPRSNHSHPAHSDTCHRQVLGGRMESI